MKFIDHNDLALLISAHDGTEQGPILIDVAGTESEKTLSFAHRVDFDRIVLNRGDTAGLLPDIDHLNAALAHTGITPNRPVVLFDAQNGLAASRLAWTLALAGFRDINLLDGGRNTLNDHADLALSVPVPATKPPPPLKYDLSQHHANAEDIAQRLGHWLIVDARSADEYRGIDRRAKHAGHIPGAQHFDWSWCLDPNRPGHLRPDPVLLDRLAERDIRPDDGRPIAVYCQSHRRSSLLFCVLKHLGFVDVRGYPGAWSDWGNRDDLPIEPGPEEPDHRVD